MNLKNISCKEDFCWQNETSSGGFLAFIDDFWTIGIAFMHTKHETEEKLFLIVMLSEFSSETTYTIPSKVCYRIR